MQHTTLNLIKNTSNEYEKIQNALDLMYMTENNEYKYAYAKTSISAPSHIVIAHNYANDLKKDTIKLMILAAVAYQKPLPKIVKSYLEDGYIISAPTQRKDIVKFIVENTDFENNQELLAIVNKYLANDNISGMEKNAMNDFIAPHKGKTSFPPGAANAKFQEAVKNFQESIELNQHVFLLQDIKTTLSAAMTIAFPNEMLRKNETPVSKFLRTSMIQISQSILGQTNVRTDAERDLERNPDFIFGQEIIKKIDELLANNTKPEGDKLKELYLALQEAKIKIKYDVKLTSLVLRKTADQPHYESLMQLDKILTKQSQEILKTSPDIEKTAQAAIIEFNQKKKEEFKKEKGSIKETSLPELEKLFEDNNIQKAIKESSSQKTGTGEKPIPAAEMKQPGPQEAKAQQSLEQLLDSLSNQLEKLYGKSLPSTQENVAISSKLTNVIDLLNIKQALGENVSKSQPDGQLSSENIFSQLKKALEGAQPSKPKSKRVSNFFQPKTSAEKIEDKLGHIIEKGLKTLKKIDEKYEFTVNNPKNTSLPK